MDRTPFFRLPGFILLGFLMAATGCDDGSTAPVASPTMFVPPPTSDPYLVALGTAQDGGLPHAACDCIRCEQARRDPSAGRHVASLALVLPGSPPSVFLFDATPDLREQWSDFVRPIRGGQAGKVDRTPVDGVFLTHAHLGHYTGLAFLGFEAVHTRGVPVFCTPRMAAYLAANGPWSQLVDLGNIELESREIELPVQLEGGVTVTSFAVPHRDEFSDTVGYRITGPTRTVLYVPDTDGFEHWVPGLEERLSGADVAILDGTFYSSEELPGRDVSSIGHPWVRATMDGLESQVRSGTVSVWFTHFNHSNPLLNADGQVRDQLESRGFHVLDDGTVLPL